MNASNNDYWVPNALIEKGEFNRVPIVVGSNRDEGNVFKDWLPRYVSTNSGLKQAWVDFTGHIVGPDLVRDMYQLYGPIANNAEFERACVGLFGDLFTCAAEDLARAASKHTEVFYYRFTQSQDWLTRLKASNYFARGFLLGRRHRDTSTWGYGLLLLGGVPHSLDLYYIFDVKSHKNDRRHIFMYHGRRISQYFMGYWGRFAHTGNPNGARGALSRSNLTEVSFPEWPRYRESQHMRHWATIGDLR